MSVTVRLYDYDTPLSRPRLVGNLALQSAYRLAQLCMKALRSKVEWKARTYTLLVPPPRRASAPVIARGSFASVNLLYAQNCSH